MYLALSRSFNAEILRCDPMALVRVKDASKRLHRPSVLTAEEFHGLLAHIREPYRTMVLIAGCLGLRAGEIVRLQWGRLRFREINPTGTAQLAAELVRFRAQSYSTEEGWLLRTLGRESHTTRRKFNTSAFRQR